ncbi:hypothetical protein Mal52_44780 [Symmachiella dynata]|uniref:Lipoprotein n=1 Tax=Symmachiella dynata TaxID=2527995 RepID=A0A517ZU28_9PLAN|nr:hypothetical protein [Symmachiella dynata]QDU45981.1 hypothetical protein Mal52_44780 [Symmachiella dynata]
MKLLQGKWLAGALSLAFVVSCMGGCVKPEGTPAAGSTTGTTDAPAEEAAEGETGVDVPAPEAAAGTEEKTE